MIQGRSDKFGTSILLSIIKLHRGVAKFSLGELDVVSK